AAVAVHRHRQPGRPGIGRARAPRTSRVVPHISRRHNGHNGAARVAVTGVTSALAAIMWDRKGPHTGLFYPTSSTPPMAPGFARTGGRCGGRLLGERPIAAPAGRYSAKAMLGAARGTLAAPATDSNAGGCTPVPANPAQFADCPTAGRRTSSRAATARPG